MKRRAADDGTAAEASTSGGVPARHRPRARAAPTVLPLLSDTVRLEVMQREVTLGVMGPEPVPGMTAVPSTFGDRVQYARVFAPLLLEEAREALRQEVAPRNEGVVTVVQASLTGDWMSLRVLRQERDERFLRAEVAVLRSLGASGAGPPRQVAGASSPIHPAVVRPTGAH